jgi:hypothetical protein
VLLGVLADHGGLGSEGPHETAGAVETIAAAREGLTEIFRWTAKDSRGMGTLRLWFVGESVTLAAYGGYTDPSRNMTEPLVHREWSERLDARSLIRDLIEKYREQYVRVSGDRAGFAARALQRCAAWGGPPFQDPRGLAAAELWHTVVLAVRRTGTEVLRRNRITENT